MKWLNLSVVYLLVFVIKCMGMSVSELEDFSNFLKRTSQLDETLKKGTNPDDVFDEDEPVSDHAWEESGKFEGDLILNERQRRLIVEDVAEGLSRNGLKDSTKRWPNNLVIYYIQREHFTGDQVQAIEDGIEDLGRASCVKFKPYKKGDRDAVVIQGSRRGCFSQVGYQGGYQVLNLSGRHPVGRGCFRHGTVVHELLHTLGFYHMQSSPDRDDYINVHWENIIEPARHNFRKYNSFAVSDFGVGYDYESVLHYSRRAFSKNGRDTLVPKMSGASIGQRIGLSDKDTQKLNKMYCDANSNNFEGSEEETTQKATIHKKNSKNKPFEGQGIGYHQGKTVVIKLPAAETYKLPDSSTFHVFDYFSKAPQAVSPSLAEGFGTGKKIGHSYKQPVINSEAYDKTPTFYTKLHENSYDGLKLHNIHDKDKDDQSKAQESTGSPLNENKHEINHQIYEIPKHFSQDAENWRGNSVKFGDDLNEAFERLGKIIKTHVYPSHTPNLNVYKTNTDYSDFYKPAKTFEPEPEIAKVDEAFHTSLPAKIKEDETYYTKELNPKTPQNFIQSLYSPNTSSQNKDHDHITADNIEKVKSPTEDEETIEEVDSSYGTSYPLKQMYKIKEENIIDPEFAKLENLVYKHNLSSLYSQIKDGNDKYSQIKDDNDKPLEEKHKVFGHVVPQGDGKYRNPERIPEKYTLYKYTYPSDEHSSYYSEPSEKLRNYYDPEKEFDSSPSGKKSYSLYPLTQDWYNRNDYEPHNRSYMTEESESKENIR